MLTTIEQVREWITDNGFKRWVLYRDYGRTEKILDSAGLAVADMPDKLAMTEKYLRLAGGHAYAAGSITNASNDLTFIAEIQLTEQQAPAAGVGFTPQPIDEAAMEKRIEARLRAEYERKEYEQKNADLERREKEFSEKQNSAMGALVHYFAPIGQALLGSRRMVAGVDAERPVHTAPIVVEEHAEEPDEEKQEEEIFTDEESDKLFELMARFKKAEPDYLKLITRVVEMAESGDGTYTMAKGFLLK